MLKLNMHTRPRGHARGDIQEVMTTKFRKYMWQKGGEYVIGTKHINGACGWLAKFYFLM